MKLGPKSLRFTLPVWAMFRDYLKLAGRDNTLHLHETALVIEGNFRIFSLPLFHSFVESALCGRSLRTIPYSTIRGHRYCTYRAVWACWLLVASIVFTLIPDPATGALDAGYNRAIFGMSFLALTALLAWVIRRRHALAFRGAEGRQGLVCFHIRRRAERLEFESLLRRNCAAAGSATEGWYFDPTREYPQARFGPATLAAWVICGVLYGVLGLTAVAVSQPSIRGNSGEAVWLPWLQSAPFAGLAIGTTLLMPVWRWRRRRFAFSPGAWLLICVALQFVTQIAVAWAGRNLFATNRDPWLNPWSILHWLALVSRYSLIVPALLADCPKPYRIWFLCAALGQFAGSTMAIEGLRPGSAIDVTIFLAILAFPPISLTILALALRRRFEDWIDRLGVCTYIASHLLTVLLLLPKTFN